MTSVQKFLRQRHVPNTILQAPTNACYYVFVAGSGNYVGNYPPGYMQLAGAVPAPSAGSLIRDMGKTIKASISANSGVTLGTEGFFRAVQVIDPSSPLYATSSTTFGVGTNSSGAEAQPSGNVGDAGYGTYYIPIVVEGIIASTAVLPTTYLPLGGQL